MAESIIIRKATQRDLVWLAEQDAHISLPELDHALQQGRVLLAEVDGTPAGWLRWNLFWDNTPFMNLLYLLEGYRRMGLGRALVRRWEQAMARAGYTQVMTSTAADECAQHFYRHLGYRDIGGFTLGSDPYELLMSKVLPPEDPC